jgi:hypothetical protein
MIVREFSEIHRYCSANKASPPKKTAYTSDPPDLRLFSSCVSESEGECGQQATAGVISVESAQSPQPFYAVCKLSASWFVSIFSVPIYLIIFHIHLLYRGATTTSAVGAVATSRSVNDTYTARPCIPFHLKHSHEKSSSHYALSYISQAWFHPAPRLYSRFLLSQQQLQYPNLATTTTSYAQFLEHHRKLSVNFLSQTVHDALSLLSLTKLSTPPK